jgi:hypothetical protein
VRALVFIAMVLAGDAWAAWEAARADPDDGANIGLGLVVFAVNLLVAFAWGAFDRWRELRSGWLVARWAVVGLVTGCFAPVHLQSGTGPLDVMVLLSDFASVGLFLATLVAGAAVGGGTLAAGLVRPQTSTAHR